MELVEEAVCGRELSFVTVGLLFTVGNSCLFVANGLNTHNDIDEGTDQKGHHVAVIVLVNFVHLGR